MTSLTEKFTKALSLQTNTKEIDQRNYDELLDNYFSLKKTHANLLSSLHEKNHLNYILENDNDRLKAEHQVLLAKITEIAKSFDDCNDKLAAEGLSHKKTQLDQKNAAKAVASIHDELSNCQMTIRRDKSELQRYKQQCSSIEQALTHMNSKLSEYKEASLLLLRSEKRVQLLQKYLSDKEKQFNVVLCLNADLESKYEILRNTYHDKNIQLNFTCHCLQRRTNYLKSILSNLNDKNTELNYFIRLTDKKDEEIRRHHNNQESLIAKIATLENELSKLVEVNSTVTMLRLENDNLQQELQKHREDNKCLQSNNIELKKDCEKTKMCYIDMYTNLSTGLNTTLRHIEKSLRSNTEAWDESTCITTKYHTENQALGSEGSLAQLEEINTMSKDTADVLHKNRDSITDLDKHIKSFFDTLSSSFQLLLDNANENRRSLDYIDELTKDKEAMRNNHEIKVDELTNAIFTLKSEKSQLVQDRDTCIAKSRDLENSIVIRVHENNIYLEKIDKLQSELTLAVDEKYCAEVESNNLRNELEKCKFISDTQLQNTISQFEKLEFLKDDKIRNLQYKEAEFINEITSLKSTIAENTHCINSLKEKLCREKEQNQRFECEVEKERFLKETALQDVSKLSMKLSEQNLKITELQNNIDTCQKESGEKIDQLNQSWSVKMTSIENELIDARLKIDEYVEISRSKDDEIHGLRDSFTKELASITRNQESNLHNVSEILTKSDESTKESIDQLKTTLENGLQENAETHRKNAINTVNELRRDLYEFRDCQESSSSSIYNKLYDEICKLHQAQNSDEKWQIQFKKYLLEILEKMNDLQVKAPKEEKIATKVNKLSLPLPKEKVPTRAMSARHLTPTPLMTKRMTSAASYYQYASYHSPGELPPHLLQANTYIPI